MKELQILDPIQDPYESYLENQTLSDPARRVIGRVLVPRQIPRPHERDRHRVAENHLNRGRSHRRQIERAQLPLQRQMHVQVTHSPQQIVLGRGHRDQVRPFRLGAGSQLEQLLRVSGLAEEDNGVGRTAAENADVAVQGVDRGEEGGANAEGDEGLGDLLGDEARLADAGEEDGALDFEKGLGEYEGLVEIKVMEEEVEILLLGFEEVHELGSVYLFEMTMGV